MYWIGHSQVPQNLQYSPRVNVLGYIPSLTINVWSLCPYVFTFTLSSRVIHAFRQTQIHCSAHKM